MTKPTATAYSQAAFMGWYNGDTELTNDYVITEDITATANFMSWFTHTSDTVTGLSAAWTKSGKPSDITVPVMIDGCQMTTIGNSALYFRQHADTLTSVNIENGYKTIGDWAFFSSENMRSMTIPSTITSIGEHAFQRVGYNTNGALGSLTLPSGLKSIGKSAFLYCGWTKITVPDGCAIDESSNVFSFSPYLTYLKIGTGTSDFRYIFQQSPALETLILPSTTRTLSANPSFVSMPKLTSVTIYASKSLISGSMAELNNANYAPKAMIYYR